jgi:general secretion pathway protein C
MKVPKALETIQGLNIHKLLRKHFVERLVLILRIVVLLLIVLLLFVAGNSVMENSKTGGAKISEFKQKIDQAKHEALESARTPVASPNLTNVYNPFGVISATTPGPGAQAAPTKAPSTLPMTLIGTFISTGQPAYAIIEEQKKKTQEDFKLNDTVFGEAKLVAIFSDRVEIERNGKVEILSLDTAPDKGSEIKGGVAAVDENEFVVDGAELDKAFENLPLLLTQARAVPYFKEGRAVGLRLFAIKSGSLFERLGIQNGDVLKSVNGNSLADLSQALQLFQKLKEEKSVALVMERNMQEREFKYQIR